jgi:predicted amidohydrolase YtcJ
MLKTVSTSLLVTSCALLPAMLTSGCAPAPEAADLVLLGGKIVTVDPDRPEVQALAAADGVIVAVGSNAQIERYRGPETEVIDLAGRLAVPGFIESHGHFTGLGRSRMVLDVSRARSWDEIVEMVAEVAQRAEPGQWIVGWGWHQEKWDAPPRPAVDGYPTHETLSRVTPDNPVLLRHAAGSHAGLLNAAAMERIELDATTVDPSGGSIVRDARGNPTGLLRERAYAVANDVWEADQAKRIREELALAAEECLSKGVTTFQDAGSKFSEIDVMREMAGEGTLGVRLWVMIEEENDVLEARIADYRILGEAADHLTVRAIKKEIDGALGSHTAWLLEPYTDQADTTGINTTPLDDIEQSARIALEHGLQLCVHAIGDRGNRETLDLFQRLFEERGAGDDLRWRIEHAQHLATEDIPRFAQLGVVASMQGIHCTSDGPWVPQRLGARRAAEGAYVWRSLIDSGALVCNGTDTPVEDVDPIANFYASVTRNTPRDGAFHPEQRMTRQEALRSYTINAARAAFEEQVKGSLTPGKLADVVVLSQDILAVPDERIPETEVLYTIVGGEVRYRRDGE